MPDRKQYGPCYYFYVLDMSQIAPSSVRPLARTEYDSLVKLGWFENEHIELLYGTLVTMSPHGSLHAEVLHRLSKILFVAIGDEAVVRIQSPFAIEDHSEPEPDIAVVPPGNYADGHPQIAWFIIEVAETSIRKDSTVKVNLYAQAQVPEYWVVNLAAQKVDVYRNPIDGTYRDVTCRQLGDTLHLLRFPNIRVDVSSILS